MQPNRRIRKECRGRALISRPQAVMIRKMLWCYDGDKIWDRRTLNSLIGQGLVERTGLGFYQATDKGMEQLERYDRRKAMVENLGVKPRERKVG